MSFTHREIMSSPQSFTPQSDGLIYKSALFTGLLFIFLIPWGNSIWDGLSRVVGMLAFAVAGLQIIVHGANRNFSYYHIIVVAFFAWMFLSLMWSSEAILGMDDLITAIQLLMMVFLFSLILNNKRKINQAYQAYVLGNITGSGIIIYNFLNGIQSNYYGRYGIANFEVDGLSIILALALPMAAYLTTQYQSKLWRILNLLAIPLIFYAIFLTATRTGSIVALIAIFYWVFIHRKASMRIKLSLFGVLIASVIAIFSLAPKQSVERIFSSVKEIKSGTLNQRTTIWKGTINAWKERPVIGTGLAGLKQLTQQHIAFRHAHNTYLHIMAETGIIGITLYCLVILAVFHLFMNNPINEKAFLFAQLCVVLVSQITLNTHTYKETWMVLTLIASHAYLNNLMPRPSH